MGGGLFGWASDVVKHTNQQETEEDTIPIILTNEQQQYAITLDNKTSELNRKIKELRSRIPPHHISQRLPHLHAHSLASNANLTLQLNAHSSTKQHIQQREVTLQEENGAFENAISDCQKKIHDKFHESQLLATKLQEMETTEEILKAELEKSLVSYDGEKSRELSIESRIDAERDAETSKYKLQEELENKKSELRSIEEMVKDLEKRWSLVQENALKHPSPVQREKLLDRQLHSLIEQLASKQAQAEGLVSEIHLKEMELERLNGLWRRVEANTVEVNAARNRFGRNISGKDFSSDYMVDPHLRTYGARTETQQRLMLLRSAFVVYILALHVLVFIRISF